MVSKNNTRLYQEKMDKQQLRYSLKKLNVGVASVLVGFTFGATMLTAQASADDAPAETQTVNVADLATDNSANLTESKAATTTTSTAPAYTPVTDESNPHRSNVVPDRATTTPDYDNENGDRFGKLVDDYKIGWVRQQLASRPNDPGFVLSDDGLTLIYRVSAGDTTEFNVNDILELLYAQNVENPSQVIWGTDKRYAENKQTDDNGVKWDYRRGYRYYANGTQVQVLDIVDKDRMGDFSMDLNPAKYATAPTTTELVVPADDDSYTVHYPGAVIKTKEDNVNYYADQEMKKGYLVATNKVANRMGYAQDFVGLQTLRFAIVPVNAAPWINIPATAAKMGLENAPYNDQENKVEYYQAADVAGLKNIIKDNMVVKDYMDDYAGLPVKDTTLKIVDEAGKEVTPDQMKENTLYTVVMTATDNGDLVTHDSFNVVAGKLPAKSAAPTDLAVTEDGKQVTGKAKSGATVTVTDPDGKEIGTTKADDQGNFTVDLTTPQTKGQKLTVAAQEPGNRPATSTVDAPNIVDKSGLDKAIKDGKDTQAGDNYNNASDADKKALDDAIKNGEDVKNASDATQDQVDKATKDINDAIKNINDKATPSKQPSDVTAVKDENGTNVTGKATQGATVTVTDKDGNVLGTAKADDKGNFVVPVKDTDATDLKVTAQEPGKKVSDPVDVTVVDKTGLEKAIKDGKDTQAGDNYNNASDADKKVLDDAIKHGEDVKNDPNATKQQVDEATKAIEDAIKNINDKANNGQENVDKSGLEKAINDGKDTQAGDNYNNADDADKKALDDAIKHGEAVKNDPNATQDQVDEATKAIEDAIKNINDKANNGQENVDKSGLEKAINDGKDTQAGDNYKNADDADKKALDDAIKNGEAVKNDPNATQDQVNEATKAIEDAIKNINDKANNGQENVDKSGLEKALNDGKDTQAGDNYKNADDADKKALDDAIKNGEAVKNDPNATQDQVNEATKAIEDAIKNINDKANNGQENVDKSGLEKALNDGKDTQAGDNYKNADDADKKALDDAIKNGEAVKNDPKATQDQVNEATKAIEDAIKNINDKANNGQNDVDKSGLEKAIKDGKDTQAGDNYNNADDADKKALDDALANGDKVKNDPNATQQQVDEATKAIEDAIKNINDKANTPSTKPSDVTAVKDENGTNVTGKATPGATVTVTDKDGNVLGTAKADDKGNFVVPVKDTDATDLKVTAQEPGKKASDPVDVTVVDKTGLEKAIENGKDFQNSDNYNNASDADKKALDDALANGDKVKNDPNATQQQVDEATKAIEDAIKNINDKANTPSTKPSDVTAVKDENGTNVTGKATPGATVTVTDKDGNVLGTAKADDKGNFVVPVKDTDATDLKVTAQEPGKKASDPVDVTIVDKTGLEKAIENGKDFQNGDVYNNASDADKKALDDALANGDKVKNDPNATQQQVDEATKAIEDAIKNINDKANTPSTKPSDVTAVKDENGTNVTGKAAPNADVTVTDKDGNVLGTAKADDQGNFVVPVKDSDATELKVTAKEEGKKASDPVDVTVVDKTNLEKAINDGKDFQTSDVYDNAADADKKALDDAIKHGEAVKNDPNATQAQVDAAEQAIRDAIKTIDDKANQVTSQPSDVVAVKDNNGTKVTGKAAPNADVTVTDKDGNVLGTAKADDQGNFVVPVKDSNATELKVTAQEPGKKASAPVEVSVVDKSDLEDAINTGMGVQDTDAYNHASDDAKKALDDAIKHGEEVFNNPNATQDQVDEAERAIRDAIDAVTNVDKTGLEIAIDRGDLVVDSNAFDNASDADKKSLEDALAHGKDVLNEPNATQQQVDEDTKAINDAIKDVTNVDKSELESSIIDGSELADSDVFNGASDADKKALEDALAHGMDVFVDPNATQEQVDEATKAIRDAMATIKAHAVDKSGLEKAINDGNAFEMTDAFKAADTADQQSLVDAIKHGEAVLNDSNATQAQVDAAQKAIEDAMNLIKTKFAAGRYTNVNDGANHAGKTTGSQATNKQAGHKAGQLPQTGNDQANLAALGLAAASFAMMLGFKKKRD